MQKVIIAAVVLLAISYAEAKGNHPPSASWEDFKSFHGKSYESDKHEELSKANFARNAAAVKAHNQAFAQGKVSYTKELNKFADIHPAVFNQRNGYKPSGQSRRSAPAPATLSKRAALPASFDWRDTGKVSPVKDQGQCGSCWSFSATGAMESQVLLMNKPNQSFSEQQILDCDMGNGDYGCNGGMYTNAWKYIQGAPGIESESDYSYYSGFWGFNGWCMFNKNDVVGNVASFGNVGNTTEALMQALVQQGPISVAIDAQDWHLASDGIYSCGTPQLDHAVLLVGYGTTTTDKKDYWIVKNSWGTGWGDKGFFKLARGAGDCGITTDPAWVKVA